MIDAGPGQKTRRLLRSFTDGQGFSAAAVLHESNPEGFVVNGPSENTTNNETERWFDVTAEPNQEWFRAFARELANFTKRPDDVRCDTWLTPENKDRRISFRNRGAWVDFVINNWDRIEEAVIIQHNGRVTYGLFNSRHCYVRLRIEGPHESDVSRVYAELERTLSLRPCHPSPYKYRRSALEFNIGRWSQKDFALGVNRIADIIGPNPHVESAWVKSFRGDIEELTPFYDHKSFCEFIDRRANLFGEMVIQLRARSVAVGIAVPTDHKKLRIRTSLPPNDVDKLIEVWPSQLKLDQIRADDSGAFIGGAVPPSQDSPWLKYGVPVLVAFITAASTASLVFLKKSIWPDYQIHIESPIVAKNGQATSTGPELRVDWYLKPDGPSLRGIIRDAVGLVRVLPQSGAAVEKKSTPPISIPLSSGDYTLSIDVPNVPPIYVPLHMGSTVLQPPTPNK
jgi:hypothetical protein